METGVTSRKEGGPYRMETDVRMWESILGQTPKQDQQRPLCPCPFAASILYCGRPQNAALNLMGREAEVGSPLGVTCWYPSLAGILARPSGDTHTAPPRLACSLLAWYLPASSPTCPDTAKRCYAHVVSISN